MSIPNLPVNFQDDILNTEVNEKRKYQQTYNPDGSVSLEDVTAYSQKGSDFGASQVNQTNKAINDIYDERILDLDELELVTEPGFFVDAMAVKEAYTELNSNISESGSWELIGTKTNHDRIYIDTSKYKTIFCEVRNYEQYASIYLPVEYINTIDSTIEKAFTSGGYMSSTFPGMWFEIKAGKMGTAEQPYVYWNRGFVNGAPITGNYGLSVWGQI